MYPGNCEDWLICFVWHHLLYATFVCATLSPKATSSGRNLYSASFNLTSRTFPCVQINVYPPATQDQRCQMAFSCTPVYNLEVNQSFNVSSWAIYAFFQLLDRPTCSHSCSPLPLACVWHCLYAVTCGLDYLKNSFGVFIFLKLEAPQKKVWKVCVDSLQSALTSCCCWMPS